ncbi:unnamed protein product [Fraxinus pennsylvanica]|uniref:DUF3444 domain-containing protein n=1 Tax=Fraxinus pennsylvanica TaxID=56036 RepID=A0AAD2DVU6_9LAMI|nr:unnamed protein product [Fraxinus pennsylvanica]
MVNPSQGAPEEIRFPTPGVGSQGIVSNKMVRSIRQSKHISHIEIDDDNEHNDFAISSKRSRGDSKVKQDDTIDTDDLKCGNVITSCFPIDADNDKSKTKQMGTSSEESLPTRILRMKNSILEEEQLEVVIEDECETNWGSKELPIGCGRFKCGKTQYALECLSFSHQVPYEKGKKKGSLVIYPRKWEIWALFKDWDVMVCLDNVCGFVSLFQRTREGEMDSFPIGPNELFRFSHQIPCFRMPGTERRVPEGSFELEPNCLPLNPDDLRYPSMAKVCSGNVYEHISYSESGDDGEHDDIPISPKKSQSIDGSTSKEGRKDTLDSKDLMYGPLEV